MATKKLIVNYPCDGNNKRKVILILHLLKNIDKYQCENDNERFITFNVYLITIWELLFKRCIQIFNEYLLKELKLSIEFKYDTIKSIKSTFQLSEHDCRNINYLADDNNDEFWFLIAIPMLALGKKFFHHSFNNNNNDNSCNNNLTNNGDSINNYISEEEKDERLIKKELIKFAKQMNISEENINKQLNEFKIERKYLQYFHEMIFKNFNLLNYLFQKITTKENQNSTQLSFLCEFLLNEFKFYDIDLIRLLPNVTMKYPWLWQMDALKDYSNIYKRVLNINNFHLAINLPYLRFNYNKSVIGEILNEKNYLLLSLLEKIFKFKLTWQQPITSTCFNDDNLSIRYYKYLSDEEKEKYKLIITKFVCYYNDIQNRINKNRIINSKEAKSMKSK